MLALAKRIRPFLHHNPAITGAVLGIFLRAIRTMLRHESPGAGPGAQIGAISFLHRFGSSLNAHFHFHIGVIDGVFCEGPEGSVQFPEVTHLIASDWDQLQHTVRQRVLQYLHCHGRLERLLRYCARPPFALERIEATGYGVFKRSGMGS